VVARSRPLRSAASARASVPALFLEVRHLEVRIIVTGDSLESIVFVVADSEEGASVGGVIEMDVVPVNDVHVRESVLNRHAESKIRHAVHADSINIEDVLFHSTFHINTTYALTEVESVGHEGFFSCHVTRLAILTIIGNSLARGLYC
jgi:hypothetical protein